MSITKPVGSHMAGLITDIWPASNMLSKMKFQTDILKVNGELLSDRNLQTIMLENQNSISFAQTLTLLNPTGLLYAQKCATVCALSERVSNAAKLDRVAELTLRSIEHRPISQNPPLYNQEKHLSLNNFMETEWEIWMLEQGLRAASSRKYLPLIFSDKKSIRDHVQKIVKDVSHMSLHDTTTQIIEDLGLDSETSYQRKGKFNNYFFDDSKSLETNFIDLYIYHRNSKITLREVATLLF